MHNNLHRRKENSMRSKYKMRLLIAILLALAGLGVYGLSIRLVPSLDWVSIVMLVGAVIINLTIRCPSCGHHLTRKGTFGIPHYCPNCGTAICDGEHEE